MMYKKALFLMMVLTTQLSGCTAILWNNSDSGTLATGKVVSTHADRVTVDQDQIVGFAYLKEDFTSKNNTSKNNADIKNLDTSLIVIGQKYAYMIDIGNQQILETIQSDLDPTYWRIRPVRSSENYFGLSLLPQIDDDKHLQQLKFSADIELYYAKDKLTQNEQQQLSRLSLSQYEYGQENSAFYRRKIGLVGHIVGLNAEMNKMKFQHFSQNYPIEIYTSGKTHYSLHTKTLLQKVALTPVTLAGDIVAIPLYLLFNIGTTIKNIVH
ncbi:hypothetical protein ACG9YX_11585 [Acinetobacter nematophilus]|uniref:hypothetical protein n=1 Tax=Acinetobacter nematophilus TaxID=2994642 RepID=UPI003AF94D5E